MFAHRSPGVKKLCSDVVVWFPCFSLMYELMRSLCYIPRFLVYNGSPFYMRPSATFTNINQYIHQSQQYGTQMKDAYIDKMNARIVGILMLINCCFHLYQTGKRPFNMSRYSFNAMIQLSRQLPLDAELEVLLHYRVPHSKKVAKLINIRFKACNTFTALPLVPLLKNIIDKIAAHGNFPLTCPVRGNVMYNASNLIITDAILPSYMPIVQFNFTLNILNKGKAICHYLVQGSTTAKT